MKVFVANIISIIVLLLSIFIMGYVIYQNDIYDDGIPSDDSQAPYIVVSVNGIQPLEKEDKDRLINEFGVDSTNCEYTLELSVKHYKGWKPFLKKLKIYRPCNNYEVGDKMFFVPIIKTK